MDVPEHLARRLEQEGGKSLEFFGDLPASAWRAQVYSSGSGWSVREILAHFTSAERGFHALVEDILAGGSGAPQGFDIDRFNEEEVASLAGQNPEALLEAFAETRRRSVALAGGLAPEDLVKSGRHPWFGDTEIGGMLKLIYRHNQLHQRDIRKALAAGSPLPAEGSLPASETGTGDPE